MKKNILILVNLLCSSLVFCQVGVETQDPTESLDVNGVARIRSLPVNGSINTIHTTSAGTGSTGGQDQPYNAVSILGTDNNGVLGIIGSLGTNNLAFESMLDLRGNTSNRQTVNVGSTVDVNGLNSISITVPAGQKRLITFYFTGFARGINIANDFGQGHFSLLNITDGVKVASAYADFYSQNSPAFMSAPVNTGFNKSLILTNTGTSAKTWQFKMTYTAQATRPGNGAHLINFFDNPNFIGQDFDDVEAVRCKLLAMIYYID